MYFRYVQYYNIIIYPYNAYNIAILYFYLFRFRFFGVFFK